MLVPLPLIWQSLFFSIDEPCPRFARRLIALHG
jgi:hypothetical protein